MVDPRNVYQSFQSALEALETWEEDFSSCEESAYQSVAPSKINSSIEPEMLPDVCFDFLDVSHANSLSHCWAFRIVCLLQLSSLEHELRDRMKTDETLCLETNRSAEILELCTQICQALPYLLQPEMSLYGPLSAAFPLRMVSESVKMLQIQNPIQVKWCSAIQKQLLRTGILPL